MTDWHLMETGNEQVILVNSDNKVIGQTDKINAHRGQGKLHRAITVLLKNKAGELLVTQRSSNKPLWPEWWDLACSTHQWPGESSVEAAIRRLPFEIGVAVQDLSEELTYEYHAVYNEEWSENEINHLVVGELNQNPQLNPREAIAFAWKTLEQITTELALPDHRYAPWLELALERWQESLLLKNK